MLSAEFHDVPSNSGIVRRAMLIATAVVAIHTGAPGAGAERERNPMSINLTSIAFQDGQPIPIKYTCQGLDVSPPLQWSVAPTTAKGLVLICDDPDAPVGTWVHWVLYHLPARATGLPEGVPTTDTLNNGAHQGVNDFKRVGYGGPCPPPGGPHRYFFKLYAVDIDVTLKPRPTKQEVMRAIEGHIVAEGQLMGTYQRR
jgi:Raf kinase inhibitor-like YbhB/YbcL family protein